MAATGIDYRLRNDPYWSRHGSYRILQDGVFRDRPVANAPRMLAFYRVWDAMRDVLGHLAGCPEEISSESWAMSRNLEWWLIRMELRARDRKPFEFLVWTINLLELAQRARPQVPERQREAWLAALVALETASRECDAIHSHKARGIPDPANDTSTPTRAYSGSGNRWR